jgi:hypothetical protein
MTSSWAVSASSHTEVGSVACDSDEDSMNNKPPAAATAARITMSRSASYDEDDSMSNDGGCSCKAIIEQNGNIKRILFAMALGVLVAGGRTNHKKSITGLLQGALRIFLLQEAVHTSEKGSSYTMKSPAVCWWLILISKNPQDSEIGVFPDWRHICQSTRLGIKKILSTLHQKYHCSKLHWRLQMLRALNKLLLLVQHKHHDAPWGVKEYMRLAHVIADDSVRVNFYIGMTA